MVSKRSVDLFHKASKEIPAYKDFLANHKVNPSHIHSEDDFGKVPLTSKKNYLVPHTIEELVWKADFNNVLTFCSTSGSTGKPYYFPRKENLAQQLSYAIEDYINYSSYGEGNTLVLVAFGMGVWIGGVLTLRGFEIAASRMRQPISLLPVGYNKPEIFKALKDLAPNFDQTILVGYPPFIKELVDEAPENNIDLTKLHMRLMFAAETFTETFRDYVCKKAGVNSPVLDTLNTYGTADIGAMAHETPLSILIRRLTLEDPMLFIDVFGQIEKTPTLAQYNPEFIEFEEKLGELIITGDGALPLVRYAIGDHGGVRTYDELEKRMAIYKINLANEIKKAGIEHTVKKDPFVFVYERVDLAATLHGIIIYPEFIKEGLLSTKVSPFFTERFTMSTKYDIHHNQFLQVNLELQPGLVPTPELEVKARKVITKSMIEKSSEFAEVSKSKSSEALLRVILWPNKHSRYFSAGVKQKWVEKA